MSQCHERPALAIFAGGKTLNPGGCPRFADILLAPKAILVQRSTFQRQHANKASIHQSFVLDPHRALCMQLAQVHPLFLAKVLSLGKSSPSYVVPLNTRKAVSQDQDVSGIALS